jgi:hypothetical protein
MDLKRIFTFSNIYIKCPAGTAEIGKMGWNVDFSKKRVVGIDKSFP